jgi:hypothetical protein
VPAKVNPTFKFPALSKSTPTKRVKLGGKDKQRNPKSFVAHRMFVTPESSARNAEVGSNWYGILIRHNIHISWTNRSHQEDVTTYEKTVQKQALKKNINVLTSN